MSTPRSSSAAELEVAMNDGSSEVKIPICYRVRSLP